MNLEEIMGYKFKSPDLLMNSLVRVDFVDLGSLYKDSKEYVHPTILENIGDSVLDLIIRKRNHREVRNKGELDKIRQTFTNNYRLTQFSLSIELE